MVGLQDLRGQLIQISKVLNRRFLCQPPGYPQIDMLGVFRQNILLLRILQHGNAGLQLL